MQSTILDICQGSTMELVEVYTARACLCATPNQQILADGKPIRLCAVNPGQLLLTEGLRTEQVLEVRRIVAMAPVYSIQTRKGNWFAQGYLVLS